MTTNTSLRIAPTAPKKNTSRLTARAVHDEVAPRLAAVEKALDAGARPASRFCSTMTVALGVFVPAISLTMSSLAAQQFMSGGVVLGGAFAVLVGCVLLVSLTHLAEAIEDLTGSSRLISWATAITFDACLVAFEVAHKLGEGGAVVPVMIAAVAVISAALNVHAFRLAQRHRNAL